MPDRRPAKPAFLRRHGFALLCLAPAQCPGATLYAFAGLPVWQCCSASTLRVLTYWQLALTTKRCRGWLKHTCQACINSTRNDGPKRPLADTVPERHFEGIITGSATLPLSCASQVQDFTTLGCSGADQLSQWGLTPGRLSARPL